MKETTDKFDREKIKDIDLLLDLNRYLEDIGKPSQLSINYHGLRDLNPDKTYPLFVAWNHPFPVVTVSTATNTKLFQLPAEIGYAIEKILGNVKNRQDYDKRIRDAFKRKKQYLEK